MEKLSLLIDKKVHRGEWSLILGRNGPTVSHLLFVDDLLLFARATISQVRVVNNTMNEFCSASGLKVNFEKSKVLCSRDVPRRRQRTNRNISNIQLTTRLEKHLGIPLMMGGVGRQDLVHLDFIMDKLTQKLASWKNNLLNRAGRINLARSVLTAMPSYVMQTLWFPQTVCNAIDAHIRRVIWKGTGDRGIHLVNWEKITLPSNMGGLVIRKAR